MNENRQHGEAALVKLQDQFLGYYRDLHTLSVSCTEAIATRGAEELQVTPEFSATLLQFVERFLHDKPVPFGAGVIFSRQAVNGKLGALEWWIRDASGQLSRAQIAIDPDDDKFYNFHTLDWFVEVVSNHRPSFTGPYVDYLGVDEYILTLTSPLYWQGNVIGVTGTDIRVSDLERDFLSTAATESEQSILLNPHNTVVLSTTSRFLVGDRIGQTPEGFAKTRLPILEELSLTLLHKP